MTAGRTADDVREGSPEAVGCRDEPFGPLFARDGEMLLKWPLPASSTLDSDRSRVNCGHGVRG